MKRPAMRMAMLAVVAVVVAWTDAAAAAATRFVGSHPIAKRFGGGYCYVEAPHLHAYAPDHAVFYDSAPNGFVFIGDPTPFGYQGERHIFYGHHPIAIEGDGPVFCLIDGPHYHSYAPTDSADYRVMEGAAFYVGPLPLAYVSQRAERWKQTNDELRPFARSRPVVTVTPPAEWGGEIYIPPWVKVQLPRHSIHDARTRVRVRVRSQ